MEQTIVIRIVITDTKKGGDGTRTEERLVKKLDKLEKQEEMRRRKKKAKSNRKAFRELPRTFMKQSLEEWRDEMRHEGMELFDPFFVQYSREEIDKENKYLVSKGFGEWIMCLSAFGCGSGDWERIDRRIQQILEY